MVIFHSYVTLPEGTPLSLSWLRGSTLPDEGFAMVRPSGTLGQLT